MKLETEIKPRRDGTVIVDVDDEKYVFSDDDGRLTCEVKNKAHVARLLSLGGFFPFDATSIPAALAVVEEAQSQADDEGEPEPDDEGNESALPIEANTPPARFKPKAGKQKQ